MPRHAPDTLTTCVPMHRVVCPICGALVDVDTHWHERECGHTIKRNPATGCLHAARNGAAAMANLCRVIDSHAQRPAPLPAPREQRGMAVGAVTHNGNAAG